MALSIGMFSGAPALAPHPNALGLTSPSALAPTKQAKFELVCGLLQQGWLPAANDDTPPHTMGWPKEFGRSALRMPSLYYAAMMLATTMPAKGNAGVHHAMPEGYYKVLVFGTDTHTAKLLAWDDMRRTPMLALKPCCATSQCLQ